MSTPEYASSGTPPLKLVDRGPSAGLTVTASDDRCLRWPPAGGAGARV